VDGGNTRNERTAARRGAPVPTYTIYSYEGALAPQQVHELAEEITRCHSEVTGAPMSFVQCLFQHLGSGMRFIAGRPADPRGVHVHGSIRAGRTEEIRHRLVTRLTDTVTAVAGVPRHLVWVYLTQLPHRDMVEFGEVLPEPGLEASWLAGLPPGVREHLRHE
jgi:phenylpyruvate tautomerase PptA (4-oxalocrotonate tautomerase family)